MPTPHPAAAPLRQRTVAEVMTTDVLTTRPATGFKEVARLLTDRRVSALPVVSSRGRLIGIVSEADLLPKERRLRRPRFSALRRSWRDERGRAEATIVTDLMTITVITIPPTATLQQAARVMRDRAVRRLCVTDGEAHLLGIVTRGDLLRAFLRPDDEIAREIRDGVMLRAMWMDPAAIEIAVHDGVVRLEGEVERRSEAEIVQALAGRLDGVVAVDAHLTWRFDDRAAPRRRVQRTGRAA